MAGATCFISSTVKDFAGVRRDLKAWFEARGISARLSDHDDFPIDIGVTSHDACLRAIADSQFFVLLVGDRYGGRYGGTEQSITWREYDEALRLRVPVIALVLQPVNEAAERFAKTEKRKRKEPFTDARYVFDFINTIRKGRLDNWMHLWNGSVTHACSIIQNRLNALFKSYQRPYQDLRDRAELLPQYANARSQVDVALAAILAERDPVPFQLGFEIVLEIVEHERANLLGYTETDRYNIAAYHQVGAQLEVVARRCDKRIRRSDRRWRSGEGHVGLTFQQATTLVTRNLRHSEGWAGKASDEKNYVSAVATPLFARNKPIGVLVATSDRQDHFQGRHQPEVLTLESLALTLDMIQDRSTR